MNNRIGFVITYFQNSDLSLEYLKKVVDVISVENYYLVLATHYPIPYEIQEKCDYVIYEKLNQVTDQKYSHGVPENSAILYAFNHLKSENIEWSYKTCYDIEIVDVDYFKRWIKDYKYSFVSCQWGDVNIATHSFFANVDFILNTFPHYSNIDEMFSDSNVLELCWKKYIDNNNLQDKIFTFPDKNSFYGPNKMDQLFINYSNISFTYNVSENKFYIINNCSEELIGDLYIFDYYTDLCMYKIKNEKFPVGITFWVGPPRVSQEGNGFYLEIHLKNHKTPIRKNILIKDFKLKHHLSKKFSIFKYDEVRFHEYYDLTKFNLYQDINLKENLKDIKTYVDLGANFGMASIQFSENSECKIYMIEPDPKNLNYLNKLFGHKKNVNIIPNAISNINGEIEFYQFETSSLLSGIGKNEETKHQSKIVKVNSITPDVLFEKIEEQNIDFMKVDIEGSEYDFFENISDKNIKRISSILIEFHDNISYKIKSILEKLYKNDFDCEYVYFGEHRESFKLNNKMGIIYANKIRDENIK